MIIALDYDDTYTRDVVLWDKFIEMAQGLGHKVVCVTMRREEEVVRACFPKVDIICTNREAKWYYVQNAGIRIDVWIDDSPWFLLNNG